MGSDTPRTDAQEQWIQQVRDGAGIVAEEFLLVRMSYAEQLERELSAAQAENTRLRQIVEAFEESCGVDADEIFPPERAIAGEP